MKDERKFKDVVTSIENAEKDVDKMLSAARLDRHGSERYMNAEQKFWLLVILMGCLTFIGFFLLASLK